MLRGEIRARKTSSSDYNLFKGLACIVCTRKDSFIAGLSSRLKRRASPLLTPVASPPNKRSGSLPEAKMSEISEDDYFHDSNDEEVESDLDMDSMDDEGMGFPNIWGLLTRNQILR